LLAEPADADSAGELASHLARLDPEAPGAVGNLPGIDRFVRAWGSVTGDRAEVAIRQGVFELKRVRETASAPGRSRPATEDDRPLLRSWIDAFIAESYPQGSPLHTERLLDSRLSTGDDAGLWLWERGSSPVSLAGYSGPTGTGIRVGPVYSPPENRGRGYATSLVRELSAWLLGQGYSACFLYTDLANATSNAIYERIGYRRVAESREFRFLRG
jgi:predicted GNAT family acetyltransferase